MLTVEEDALADRPSVAAEPRAQGPGALVYRELPVDEWNKITTVPQFAHGATPDPAAARVLVAQDQTTGNIVAYWFVFTAVHVEPVWIAEDYRHRPSVVRRLWSGVKRILTSINCDLAFCCVNYDAPWANASMAQRLGFRRLPTDLYFLKTRELEAGKTNGS